MTDKDILRIAHETNLISPVPPIKEHFQDVKKSDNEYNKAVMASQLREEIKKRKRIIAGLEKEIEQLEELV